MNSPDLASHQHDENDQKYLKYVAVLQKKKG